MTIHIGMLSDFPPQTRTVVFIGNRGSDHLRELIRIAEWKGRAAYRVESAGELQPRWFAGQEEVGIVVAATDLDSVVRAVLDRLNQFAAAQVRGMLEGWRYERDQSPIFFQHPRRAASDGEDDGGAAGPAWTTPERTRSGRCGV